MSLKKRWSIFLSTVLDPWLLLLLIGSILLIFMATDQNDPKIIALLTILISISSAIWGSRLMTVWHDYTEGKALIRRGKMAIRNLILLLKNINLLEKRVFIYMDRIDNGKNNKTLSKTYFEEIIDKFHIIEEETVNSIEDWKDIIPEADVKTQIGIISDLKKELAEKQSEKNILLEQFKNIRQESEQERQDLEKQIQIREKEILKLKSDLNEKTFKIGSSILGDLSQPSGTSISQYLNDPSLFSNQESQDTFASILSKYQDQSKFITPQSLKSEIIEENDDEHTNDDEDEDDNQ
jgi:hypothetical protein